MTTCYFLDEAAYRVAQDARLALAKRREADPGWMAANNATYGWAGLDEVVPPCAMWFSPWLFDPHDPEDAERRTRALEAVRAGTFDSGSHWSLSRMYWEQWSNKRPPICVLCPNGREWCVDAKSSNGEGWTVTGDPPLLTCAPSIAVPGYHGFLQNGVFTPNL